MTFCTHSTTFILHNSSENKAKLQGKKAAINWKQYNRFKIQNYFEICQFVSFTKSYLAEVS